MKITPQTLSSLVVCLAIGAGPAGAAVDTNRGSSISYELTIDTLPQYPLGTFTAPTSGPLTVEVGASVGPVLLDWMQGTIAGQNQNHAGSVISYDIGGKATNEFTFSGAKIGEVDFPALDASSKDNATITVLIVPQTTALRKGDGRPAPTPPTGKRWLASNFRLSIPGVDASHIEKIDKISVYANTGSSSVHLVTLTVPEAFVADFVKWHNSSPKSTKSATLAYLSPDNSETRFSLSMNGVSVSSIVTGATPRNGVKLDTVVLSCTSISLNK